jgi:hypothetical protein
VRVLEELCALATLGVVDEAVRGLGMLLIPACRRLMTLLNGHGRRDVVMDNGNGRREAASQQT